MNNLELAAMVLGWLALEVTGRDLTHQHIGMYCDNILAVAWAHKLRTSKSIVSGQLLRMLGIRIHARQASGITPLNIVGEKNIMADIISRAFKEGKYFHAHANLTTHLNSNFPLPQGKSWTQCILPSKLVLQMISCLRGEQPNMASLTRLPQIASSTGSAGATTQHSATETHGSQTRTHSQPTSYSWHSLLGCGQATMVEELKSRFKASRMRLRPSPRPSCWLDNPAQSTEPMASTRKTSNA